MKPVNQTKFGMEEGNCFEACLASIFECDIGDIPVFKGSLWFSDLQEWLYTKELYYIEIEARTFCDLSIKGYHIINGDSPRLNCQHSVVGYNCKMIHDPHPDKSFFKGEPKTYGLFCRIF